MLPQVLLKLLLPKVIDYMMQTFKLDKMLDYMELPNDADRRIDSLQEEVDSLKNVAHPPVIDMDRIKAIEDKLELIESSKTNLEDESLLLREETIYEISDSPNKNTIDDDSIKGLYIDNSKYTGYYSYHPSSKTYTTGKRFTNNSKLITNKSFKIDDNKRLKALNRLTSKLMRTNKAQDKAMGITTKEQVVPELAPIRKEVKTEQKIKKGKY